jgi:hypothetical protein
VNLASPAGSVLFHSCPSPKDGQLEFLSLLETSRAKETAQRTKGLQAQALHFVQEFWGLGPDKEVSFPLFPKYQ